MIPLLLLLARGNAVELSDDPQILAALQHFSVDDTETAISRFTCGDEGARCVFRRENFRSHDFGTGQETQVDGEGATWAAVVPDADVLTLGACIASDESGCIVSCNANCACDVQLDESSDPQPCVKFVTRAPTAAPRQETAAVDQQCPERQFTEFCPQLMNTGVPIGLDDEYECYNFCGGNFVSSCDMKGNCGNLECDNKTAVGTLNGQVYGCTMQDKVKYNPGPNGSNSGSIQRTIVMTGVLAMAVATVMML